MAEEEGEGGEEDGEERSLAPKYSNLIAIQTRKRKIGLEKLLKDESMRVARLSLSEQKFENAIKTYQSDIIRSVNIK